MFTGKSGYTSSGSEHTCIVNVDKESGAFTAIMWDGTSVARDHERQSTYKGTFTRGRKRIHVFVYGGKLPIETVIALLRAWVGGKWSKTPLKAPQARKGGKR